MIGNFEFYNPTKIYFGKDSLDNLIDEIGPYDRIMVSYGQGSVKKTGLYDRVLSILKGANKTLVDDGGVMPNPTYDRVMEGCQKVRDEKVDFILALGGGSVCDYGKVVSVSANCEGDFWEKYIEKKEKPNCPIIPVGCILTMAGTGSEMNSKGVISHKGCMKKAGVRCHHFPKFSILNPEFTYTLPKYQTASGCFDILSHIMENYFSGNYDNTSDYIAEGLMRSLVNASLKVLEEPYDYEARSNIMWCACWGLNGLTECGKGGGDWEVHKIGHAISVVTDATHGMTLAAVSNKYYDIIMPYGVEKFKRFAVNVWGVNPKGKSDEAVASEGLACMKEWMRKLGLVTNMKDLGVTKDNLETILKSVVYNKGGYKQLTEEDVRYILNDCF